MKHIVLSTNRKIPQLGLGTWKTKPGEINRVIRKAIEVGYRHFDCAHIYENEQEIGQAFSEAFKAGDVRREDLWITSKLWNNSHHPDKVESALHQTLDDLQVYYLDLYLIHWPIAFRQKDLRKSSRSEFYSLKEIPLLDTWNAMLELKEKSIAKNVGVSNFSISKLKNLMDHSEAPSMNQIEIHPYLSQVELVNFCQQNNIAVTAYKPLGSGDRVTDNMKAENKPSLINHPSVLSIAEENDMSPAQVLIVWLLQRDIVVIPKSSNPQRIEENFNALNFTLTSQQMEEINKLNWNFRYVDGSFFSGGESPYSPESIWA